MHIFACQDELQIIKNFIEQNAAVKSIKSKLAESAQCHLSYLSQALNGKVYLTPDHGFGLARFMQLNEVEAEYFMLLLQLKRASSRDFRSHLENRIAELRRKHFRVERSIKAKDKVSTVEMQRYYGDWRMQAVHMYLTVPKFQQISSLATKLNCSDLEIRSLVGELERMGLAKKSGEKWIAVLKDLHVSARSPFSVANQFQWKMRALQNLQEWDSSGVHYVATFSLSNEDMEKLKSIVIDFISKSRTLVQASPEECVAHLGISFFGL